MAITRYSFKSCTSPFIAGEEAIYEFISDGSTWTATVWRMSGSVVWEGLKAVPASSTAFADVAGSYDRTGGSLAAPATRTFNFDCTIPSSSSSSEFADCVFDATAEGTIDGSRVLIGNAPPGHYTIEYVGGAVDYRTVDGRWGVNSSPPTNGYVIENASGSTILIAPSATGTFASAAAAEAASVGYSAAFNWGGGDLYLKLNDDPYTDNGSGPTAPTWRLHCGVTSSSSSQSLSSMSSSTSSDSSASTVSSQSSGSVSSSSSVTSCLVAAQPEQIGPQGENNWYYGQYADGTDTVSTFSQLPTLATGSGYYYWHGSELVGTPIVGNYTGFPTTEIIMHPGADSRGSAVLRWVSTVSGTIHIVAVANCIGGGSTNFKIIANGTTVYDAFAGGSTVNQTVTVSVGQNVDFVVNSNGDASFDSTSLSVSVYGDCSHALSENSSNSSSSSSQIVENGACTTARVITTLPFVENTDNLATGYKWYKVVSNTNCTLRVETCGGTTSFDTIITVYGGPCSSLSFIDENDDACGLQSQIDIVMTAGQPYYVRIAGYDGDQGNLTVTMTSSDCDLSP